MNDKEIFENNFLDNFGMTIDQFERLDYDVQEEIIKRFLILNKKKKKNKLHSNDILNYYPIFSKVFKKRKN